MSEIAKCEVCGEPMPPGEEVFQFHGYSGPCPKPPLPKATKMLKTFAYHKPSEEGLKKITKLRELFSQLHGELTELCPQSRERSVALTELETTAMWAIKAVVCNDPGSEITT